MAFTAIDKVLDLPVEPVSTSEHLAFDGASRERITPVSTISPPRRRRFYAPELDALRFFAFVLVFARHITSQFAAVMHRGVSMATSTPIQATTSATASAGMSRFAVLQGFTQSLDFGVCLFFFLSSFLITRLLLLERQETGRIAIGEFYMRRSLRIWPLYFFFLAAIVGLAHFIPALHVEHARLIASLLFVSNWVAVLHGWSSISIQPLWSISVEEQFYLVWPWFARRGRTMILIICIILVLLSIGTLFILGSRAGTRVTALWPNTLIQAIFFAGGAVTAVLGSPEDRRLGFFPRIGLIGSGFGAWLVASAGFHVVRTESPGPYSLIIGYLLVLLGTYLIFIGVAGWRTTRIPGWLIYLGRISYGLYVMHVSCMIVMESTLWPRLIRMPLFAHSIVLSELVIAGCGFLLTVLCAAVTYRYIERPFLNLKKRFTVIPSRPA